MEGMNLIFKADNTNMCILNNTWCAAEIKAGSNAENAAAAAAAAADEGLL